MIFHGQDENQLLSKTYIWQEMKFFAVRVWVNKKKVHTHSFQHLFARAFMETSGGGVVELANILGNSSLEITRIYICSSGQEKRSLVFKQGIFKQCSWK